MGGVDVQWAGLSGCGRGNGLLGVVMVKWAGLWNGGGA